MINSFPRRIPESEPMTVAPDVHLADCEHAVELYSRVDDLMDVLVAHFSGPLRNGDAAVIIAIPEHRDALKTGLMSAGIDVGASIADGQLLLLDAAEMLGRLLVDGRIDAAAFDKTVGNVVREAGIRGGQVRTYGEMVALLWQSGDIAGAAELERLWNDLSNEASFSLLCAYPVDLVSAPENADAFSEMCALHRRVITGAATPPGADVTRRFACNVVGPRLARRFVTETLTSWRRLDLLTDSLLVVSELATNAVCHARTDFTVSISEWNDGVTLMVGDASPEPPVERDTDMTAPSGRGLRLVTESADRWGYFPAGVGKLVWAHVAPTVESEVG
jgi:hypothetical protein